MKMKKVTALLMSAMMVTGLLAGCGSSKEETTAAAAETTAAAAAETTAAAAAETTAAAEETEAASAEGGKIYYLNFKPEAAEKWEEIMAAYTEKTGVETTVITAAAGTYEQTLKSEIAKTEAPTLFQINGSATGTETWKEYCADLTGTPLYDALGDKTLAVEADGKVIGVPYTLEGYGIIYNKTIMDAYFATEGAKAASIDEINNFETFKAVVEDIQAKKDELGINGAFASTSFAAGEDWRWQTHLANMPLYYEFKDRGITGDEIPAELEGTYMENYKNIFDLYINDSVIEPGLISSKTTTDAMIEFGMGECVFTQNGNWAWGDIKDNEVEAEEVGYLPIYIGAEGEENQGLCVGTENYWCVNGKASEADQKATMDFINWLINDPEGKAYMVQDLGFVVPFNTFGEDEAPADPLAKAIMEYSASGKESVTWAFTKMPSQQFKNDLGQALLGYAQGTGSWDDVVTAFVDGWAAETANPTPEG